MKKLKNRFFKENKLKNNKDSEILFYKDIFQQYCIKNKYKLSDFFDPLNNKGKISRSLNNDYLKFIFTYRPFKTKFFKYL